MHVDVPAIVATGVPPASTRTAPVIHCPVTHGGFGEPVSAQPAITYGDASVTIGCPDSNTRGNGAAGVACPACVHMTTGAEMQGGSGHQITVSAPVLTSVVGPSIDDDRALAVRDHDADVADGDHRAGRRLDQDPAGRPRDVADTTIPFFSVVWSVKPFTAGGTMCASTGTSAAVPQ